MKELLRMTDKETNTTSGFMCFISVRSSVCAAPFTYYYENIDYSSFKGITRHFWKYSHSLS